MENKSYEEAYKRLEEILNLMNSGQVPLDTAVALYKEADLLTRFCEKKLEEAESTLETLMKDREGQIATNPTGQPIIQEFQASRVQI